MADSSPVRNAFVRAVDAVDFEKGWDKLPVPLGLLTLMGLRDELREENVYDAYDGNPPKAPAPSPTHLRASRDGTTRQAPGTGVHMRPMACSVPRSRGHPSP